MKNLKDFDNKINELLDDEDTISSECNFGNFFETSKDMLIISYLKGNIIHCNNSLINKLGYSFTELKNKHML